MACAFGVAQRSFAAAPFAYTAPATMVTRSNAVLNGMATPNGTASLAWFEWGTNTAYGNQTESVYVGNGNTVVFVTNQVSGLTAGTVYHARLVVCNSRGITCGADLQFASEQRVWAWGNFLNEFPYPPMITPAGLDEVVGIAGGWYHSLALKSDGTVVAWGICPTDFYSTGRTEYWRYSPATVPAGLSNVVSIASGGGYELALKSDGTVVGWGNYLVDEFREYFWIPVFHPIVIPEGLGNVVAIAAGKHHTFALKNDGTVVGWNAGGRFALPENFTNIVAIAGDGVMLKNDGTVLSFFNAVPPALSNVLAVAAGDFHCLALKEDGTVTAWGGDLVGETLVPAGLSNVVAISAGAFHSIALQKDGTAVAWGWNSRGQTNVPAGLPPLVAIGAGWEHSLALGPNGAPAATPQTVSGPANFDLVIELAGTDPNGDALGFNIVSLPARGSLYQYSIGGRGEAILSTNVTVSDPNGRIIFVPGTNSYSAAYASFEFSANDGLLASTVATVLVNINAPPFVFTQEALAGAGTALLKGAVSPNGYPTVSWFEWGLTSAYGNRSETMDVGSGEKPVFVTNRIASGLNNNLPYHYRLVASNSAGVVCGADQRFAVQKKVWWWNESAAGALNGVPCVTDPLLISANENHTLALNADGSLGGWGWDWAEQINPPAGLGTITAVAAGYGHSLAIRSDGAVAAWGWNDYGQTDVPLGLSNVVAIAAGYAHSLALKNDGTVVAWGDFVPSYCHLFHTPVVVPAGLKDVVAIAAGYSHSVALKSDGTLVAWGYNDHGQTQVLPEMTNIVAIAAGAYHHLALKKDTTVLASLSGPLGYSNVVAIAASYYVSGVLKSDGTVTVAGYNRPVLTNAVSIAASDSLLALCPNQPPQASAQEVAGAPNTDLVIPLSGTDIENDPLSFRVTSLPAAGALYQYAAGSRGPAITTNNAAITDPAGRVIFVPVPGASGLAYTSFQFIANDGWLDSAPATVTVNILTISVGQATVDPDRSAIHLRFSGHTNATYSAWASTNLLDWERLGAALQTTPGTFEFHDTTLSAYPQRFYQLRWP